MSPQPEPNINPLLWKAIAETRLIRLFYQNRERILEPHDYGIHKGVAKLLGYQIAGSSRHKIPDWRWMEENLISDIQLLDRTFPGGRPTPTGKHHKWDKLFIRAKPSRNNK
ncbi:MAG: hypothetical protein JOZ48_01730 [Acidobacteriaceae bacterium]|nr:hypothetical protein [Acidobacteriaceae bacterium]